MSRIESESSTIYFHNLKFDGMFILAWLFAGGYMVDNDQRSVAPGTFKTLISKMGMFYSITVRWKSGMVTEFRDSWKKIPMSVDRIPKSFGFETTKGELDYDAFRPVGHVLTPEERDYLHRDVSIVAKALRIVIDNGAKKLTIGSDALAEYKSIMGGKAFERIFPVLSPAMDAEIRRAYRGGFTYADPRYTGRVLGSGVVLDVNSLYPSVMYNSLIPYGEPAWQSGRVEPTEAFPLTIFAVEFTAKLKKDHIPCIQIKGNMRFAETEYLREIKEPVNLMVTNVDWQLYNEHYDIEVLHWGGGWKFRATVGLFQAYIDKWSKIKAESEGGQREMAKLMLNSLYGKFATNPEVTSKIPVLTEDDVVKLKMGPDDTRLPVYTAAGVFITSHARNLTIRAAQENYANFAYADTDSLHLVTDTSSPLSGVPHNIDVHKSRMGAWKLEYYFDAAYYIRPKAYLERKHDGSYHNAIAGLPTSITSKLTFDDLTPGRIIEGKLLPKTVPGGVILMPTPFELKLS